MTQDIFYTKDHEWIKRLEDNRVRIGITSHAQNELGDVVFVELPFEDDEFDKGEYFAMVESVKSTSEVFVPFSARVLSINERLEDEPELVNDSPTDEGWIAEFELLEEFDSDQLLDSTAYENYLSSL